MTKFGPGSYYDYLGYTIAEDAINNSTQDQYAESSRAKAEVALLWAENQRLHDDLDSQKYDREFQRWAEELIYQFSKVVKAIETSPGNPINDFIDLASFLHLIEAKELDTSLIGGFEQKEKFDETVLKAQNLLTKLETNKEVQKYIREQEAARLERERQQEAARREEERLEERLRAEKAAKAARAAFRGKLIGWSILGLSVVLFIISGFVGFEQPGAFVFLCGMVLSIYLLRKHRTK